MDSLPLESKPPAVTRPEVLTSLREDAEHEDRTRYEIQEELIALHHPNRANIDLVRALSFSAWKAGREALWYDLVEGGMIVAEGEPGDVAYFGLNARDRYAEVTP